MFTVEATRKNKAPCFKWIRRFLRERSALWHSVIKSKFGILSNGWDARGAVRTSHKSPWKFIFLYEEFLRL